LVGGDDDDELMMEDELMMKEGEKESVTDMVATIGMVAVMVDNETELSGDSGGSGGKGSDGDTAEETPIEQVDTRTPL
jgi:hypothetical protein